jgi:signal transduction histidine kinase
VDLTELARLEVPEDRLVEVELVLSNRAQAFADQRLFQRVVENLLRNAVRHADRIVMLEFTEDEGYDQIAVHDDGPGIPDELRERVLVPFVRLGSDRDRKSGGVGLGLAIVRRIMQRHGGRVVIDRSPLGGARVTTRWPHPR